MLLFSCKEYPTKSNGGYLRKFYKRRGNKRVRQVTKLQLRKEVMEPEPTAKEELIYQILLLDSETYGGIDDPSFLERMTEDALREYYAGMEK